MLSRCTAHNDESPIFDPFEINFNVTEKGLIADGYAVMPEDVPLLGKQIGDTLIYYQLNDEWDSLTNKSITTNVSYRFCSIHLDTIDNLLLKKLIAKYDADIISDFVHQSETSLDSVSHNTWSYPKIFFVQHRFTKQIFRCYIGPASGAIKEKTEGYELGIDNEFPLTEKEIMQNRWTYDYRDKEN